MLKRYIIFSIVLHIALFLFFFFTIAREQKKELKRTPLIARIVTPDKTLPPPAGAPAPSAPAPQPPLTAPTPLSQPETSPAPEPPEPPPPPRDAKMLPETRKPPLPSKAKRQEPLRTPKPKVEKPRPQKSPKPPKAQDLPQHKESPESDELPAKAAAPPAAATKESSRIPPNLMGKLFDSDIIHRHASESMKKKETSNKKADIDDGEVVTFDVDDMKYRTYLRRLRESIESVWIYPEAEARRGIYGDLYISFTISKNGSLASVRIVRTSGHRSLDEAAIKALRDAAPFWPLPADWGRDTFTIQGHFVYSHFGSRIR